MNRRNFQRILYIVEVYRTLDNFSLVWWMHQRGTSSSKKFKTIKKAFNVAHSLRVKGYRVVVCRFVFNKKTRKRIMTGWIFK